MNLHTMDKNLKYQSDIIIFGRALHAEFENSVTLMKLVSYYFENAATPYQTALRKALKQPGNYRTCSRECAK